MHNFEHSKRELELIKSAQLTQNTHFLSPDISFTLIIRLRTVFVNYNILDLLFFLPSFFSFDECFDLKNFSKLSTKQHTYHDGAPRLRLKFIHEPIVSRKIFKF